MSDKLIGVIESCPCVFETSKGYKGVERTVTERSETWWVTAWGDQAEELKDLGPGVEVELTGKIKNMEKNWFTAYSIKVI